MALNGCRQENYTVCGGIILITRLALINGSRNIKIDYSIRVKITRYDIYRVVDDINDNSDFNMFTMILRCVSDRCVYVEACVVRFRSTSVDFLTVLILI